MNRHVSDEGEYFDTGDIQTLMEKRGVIEQALNNLELIADLTRRATTGEPHWNRQTRNNWRGALTNITAIRLYNPHRSEVELAENILDEEARAVNLMRR